MRLKLFVLFLAVCLVLIATPAFADRLFAKDTTTIWAPGVQYTKKTDTGKMAWLPDVYKFLIPIDLEEINRNGFDNGPLKTFYFESVYAW